MYGMRMTCRVVPFPTGPLGFKGVPIYLLYCPGIYDKATWTLGALRCLIGALLRESCPQFAVLMRKCLPYSARSGH